MLWCPVGTMLCLHGVLMACLRVPQHRVWSHVTSAVPRTWDLMPRAETPGMYSTRGACHVKSDSCMQLWCVLRGAEEMLKARPTKERHLQVSGDTCNTCLGPSCLGSHRQMDNFPLHGRSCIARYMGALLTEQPSTVSTVMCPTA
jgi:hypothetical protein